MSFLQKLVIAAAVNLEDLSPDVLSFSLIEEGRGTPGSWSEEAEAPYRLYVVKKIELSGLEKKAPALLDDLKTLKAGDYIKCDFSFKGNHGETVEVGPETVRLAGIKWVKNDTAEIEATLYGSWEGMKPQQSQRGRESA